MFRTTLGGVMMSAVLCAAGLADEMICRPVGDLQPTASTGAFESVPSELSDTGSISQWSAAHGDTLRLKVRTPEPGTYEISLRAAPALGGATLSARVWQEPLTRGGDASFTLQGTSPVRALDIRFDAVALGPGYHVVELECLAAGDALLDCVGLHRTGDLSGELGQPRAKLQDRAFLGVELGSPQRGGVTLRRVIPDTAAARAGLMDEDVLLTIDGEPLPTREEAQDVIASHLPVDRVEIELIRGTERLRLPVELGRRPESMREQRTERQKRVTEVLGVRPGQVIADIGCGSGWLSEAIAEQVGPEGTVYAVEIQERLVRRLHRWHGAHIVPVLSDPDDVTLPEDCLDTAMLHDVASHVSRDARPRFYDSVTRALKPEGRLVVFGPHGRASAMLTELRGYGFIPLDDEALAELSREELDQRLADGIVFRQH
ncbi:MAG: class I SAM-dependent methyltransferase [Planctomycetota bacterium]|jgi:SAM-dependent methyltransferase